MKWIPLLFLSAASLFGEYRSEFTRLMGENTPVWEYVATPEDRDRLQFFEELFESLGSHWNHLPDHTSKVPRAIHFIWLGPEEYPERYRKYLSDWVAAHPDWAIYFWTDNRLTPPHPHIERRDVQDLEWAFLESPYFEAVHLGEKAKILAYEILFQEGGVYIDNRVLVESPLDCLNENLDFYCFLQELGPSILSSSVIPSPHLIGAVPNHPVIREAAIWLRDHWDRLEKCYPGTTKEAQVSRIWHRTLWALSEGIDRGVGKEGRRDAVFPSSFCKGKEKLPFCYISYEKDRNWSSFSTNFSTKMQGDFVDAVHNNGNAIKSLFLLASMSLVGWVFLVVYARHV